MGNELKMAQRQQIQALIGLGWGDRAIRRETGYDRETIAKYRKQQEEKLKVLTTPAVDDGQNRPKVPTDFSSPEIQNPPKVPADIPAAAPTNSRSIHPYTEVIRSFYLQHLTAQRMYQDLVERHGYTGSYDSVKRYVRKLRKKLRH